MPMLSYNCQEEKTISQDSHPEFRLCEVLLRSFERDSYLNRSGFSLHENVRPVQTTRKMCWARQSGTESFTQSDARAVGIVCKFRARQRILMSSERVWLVGYGHHSPKRTLRGHESAGTAVARIGRGPPALGRPPLTCFMSAQNGNRPQLWFCGCGG